MIITIGRQYGSGGREIGEKLAEQLGYTYYDTLLLEKVQQNSGISRGLIEEYDERLKDKWMNLSFINGANDPNQLPVPMRAVISQFEEITKIGRTGSAVIVGRCADYVLREQQNVLSVFIHADIEQRIARVSSRNNIGKEEAEKLVRNTDKHRAAYYNYYTDKKWGASRSYNLCVDSGVFGIDGTVRLLKDSIIILQAEKNAGREIK